MRGRGTWLAMALLLIPGVAAGADDEVIKTLRDRGAKIVFEKDKPVEIYDYKAVDADLELVKQLKSLRILNLQASRVTDDGLKHLAGLDTLGTLDLSRTGVTPAGLKHVAALKGLHTFGYNLDQITDEALHELIELGLAHKLNLASGKKGRPTSPEDVTHLQFWEVRLTDKGLKELVVFKNLMGMDLTGKGWTGAGLKHLAPLKSLTNLSPKPMTDEALKALREAGMLHTLRWAEGKESTMRPKSEEEVVSFLFQSHSYLAVTGAGVRELAGLPNLERLDLSQTYLTHLAMKDVATLKSLKQLDLGDRVEDPGLKDLTALSLQTLTFIDKSPVSDAGMKFVGQIKSLQSLTLTGTKVTNAGLKELKELKLHTLRLNRTVVNDETLQLLREMDLLHAIGIGIKGEPPTSMETVNWLNLSGTQVTDEGLKELSGLKNLKGITRSGTKVTAKGIAELKKTFPDLRTDR